MRLRFVERIGQIDAASWDALFPAGYPFLRHAFIDALERSGSAAPERGWIPHHAVLEDTGGEILALAPLYLKTHSWGEFVFDFSWSSASQRLGQRYYPKWLVAVPFTPTTGPRIGAIDDAARQALVDALAQTFAEAGASSLHALFLDGAAAAAAERAGAIARHDVQFHWHHRGDADFAAFVARLNSEKRKKILRERRRVAEAGIRFEWRDGPELKAAEWAQVYALYANTYEERGQAPYLSEDFFQDYGQRADSAIKLILGYEGARMVAVAITVRGVDTLYGRHWGAAEHYHSLHFETCYYQGIEYCLRHGVRHYDAGAQGEHKLARGFEPVLTRSAHWLRDARLRDAVRGAMRHERAQIAEYQRALLEHRPYKLETPPALALTGLREDGAHG